MATVRPEDILPDHKDALVTSAGTKHRKGTTGAFFVNCQTLFAEHDDDPGGPLGKSACEKRLRVQIYDFVAANAIGECFDIKHKALKTLVEDELATRTYEEYSVDPNAVQVGGEEDLGGYTGDHFIPGSSALPTVPAADDTSRLAVYLRQVAGVRKGTFAAFVANYREARTISEDDAEKEMKRKPFLQGMREGLANIGRLGYFDFLACRDKWAQDLVEGASRVRLRKLELAEQKSAEYYKIVGAVVGVDGRRSV